MAPPIGRHSHTTSSMFSCGLKFYFIHNAAACTAVAPSPAQPSAERHGDCRLQVPARVAAAIMWVGGDRSVLRRRHPDRLQNRTPGNWQCVYGRATHVGGWKWGWGGRANALESYRKNLLRRPCDIVRGECTPVARLDGPAAKNLLAPARGGVVHTVMIL